MSINDLLKYSEDETYWRGKIKLFDVEKTLGMHLGYYEKDIHKHSDAVVNVNNFVGKLLELDKLAEETRILDAGCGVGGTIIHLAKKYPTVMFYGLNITPEEINLAKHFAQKKHVLKNTKFIIGNQENTNFSSNYFNGIIAIESIAFSKDKRKFIKEANRILKPGGKIVIIDSFIRHLRLNPFMQRMYEMYNEGRKYGMYLENEWRKNHIFDNWKKLPDLDSIEVIKTYLSESRFERIKIKDISKNVKLSMIRNDILIFIRLLNSWFSKEKKEKHPDYLKRSYIAQNMYFPTRILMSLLKLEKYYVITAIKE